MIDVFVYLVDLPPGIHEMVTPCGDGYTVYINSADCLSVQQDSYLHALKHIQNCDFEKSDVQAVEMLIHGGNDETDCDLYEGFD